MSPGPRATYVPSGILIHSAVWRQQTWAENWGGGCASFGEVLGPHLTQCCLGWRLPPCRVLSWSIQPFGHNAPALQTVRQTGHYRQTGQTTFRWHSANRFTDGRPKINVF